MSSSKSKSLAFAAIAAIVLTIFVRTRFGDEQFLCDGAACTLGSGTKWLLTGLAFVGPFLAAAGYQWSETLERRNMLDPNAKWAVPDAEQIFEVLAVLGAGLISYWLLLNGPASEAVEVRQFNAWANDLRNFRLEEGEPATDLVPARFTWFVVGGLFAVPFFFSFGSMLGREILGRRRSKAMRSESIGESDDDHPEELEEASTDDDSDD